MFFIAPRVRLGEKPTCPDRRMEDYETALSERKLLKELLLNDDWERNFRAGLRTKNAQLLEYLSSKEVLGDMIEALVNEEGKIFLLKTMTNFTYRILERTLQEASEALGVLLTNLEPVNVSFLPFQLSSVSIFLISFQKGCPRCGPFTSFLFLLRPKTNESETNVLFSPSVKFSLSKSNT